jgi:TPR repeat protein
MVGICYFNGHGVKRDYDKAREWHIKAAKQKHAGSLYDLGIIYLKGEGVQQDYTKATEYFLKAARLGDAKAQHNVAVS